MSSAGAGVEHAVHVKTQLPYALLAAVAAAIGYILAGIIGYYTDSKLALLGLPLTLLITVLSFWFCTQYKSS